MASYTVPMQPMAPAAIAQCIHDRAGEYFSSRLTPSDMKRFLAPAAKFWNAGTILAFDALIRRIIALGLVF